mgnify:CR=1 FL=1
MLHPWRNVVLRIVLLLMLLALTGCPAPLRSVTGETVDAPEGFVVLCRQVQTQVECGGKK